MNIEQDTPATLRQHLARLEAKRLRIEANENPLERAQQEDALLDVQENLEALLAQALANEKK